MRKPQCQERYILKFIDTGGKQYVEMTPKYL